MVCQHRELMECLTEESEAKNQLALELHKAEGKKKKKKKNQLITDYSKYLWYPFVHFVVLDLPVCNTFFCISNY